MPRKNVVKEYASDNYYHIYSRGVNKSEIFLDEEDKTVFLSLFKRYLSEEAFLDQEQRGYQSYRDEIDLLAYALVSNHFHLLIYQKYNERAIVEFMRSLITSYSMYFNKKYQRQGPVFQSSYLASRIDDDSYLEHISRYIHLNPDGWETSTDTSIDYYRGDRKADWIKPDLILELFDDNPLLYIEFIHDYDPESEESLFDIKDDD